MFPIGARIKGNQDFPAETEFSAGFDRAMTKYGVNIATTERGVRGPARPSQRLKSRRIARMSTQATITKQSHEQGP
jgi:hypothetical protein